MEEKQPKLSKSSKRVRMRDVANRCGVSISTVSLVLSGDPRIPEDTVRRVLQAVKALEYRPSVVARNLARRSSRTIGVILPEWAFKKNQHFYIQALDGIHQVTQSSGYKILVEATSPGFLERRYYLRLLKEQSADAILYLAALTTDQFLGEMTSEPYPFVLIGGEADGVDLPKSKGDDFSGAKMATKHLIDLGHKKIAHVGGLRASSHGRDREKGFREAMAEAGLLFEESMVIPCDFDIQKAADVTGQLINQGVTGIFSATDGMAYGVMRAALNLGKKVPEDLSVVGMDDLLLSEWIGPSLTTVRYDIATMASMAAKYVIGKIQSPLVKKHILNEMPKPELLVRESSGEPRA